MPDFSQWVTKGRGFGSRFYGASGSLVAADVGEPMTLAYRNDFRVQKDFLARTTNTLWPVTNGSAHLYRPQQVAFGPNGLVIQAIKDASGQWYSGLVDTRGTSNYGRTGSGLQFLGAFRFKARVRMSAAVGMWPSIWFKPQPLSATDVNQANEYGGFPTKGEIDMFESIGNGRFYWTIHGDQPFGSGISGHWTQPPSPNYTTGVDVTQWHEIWLDWRPGIGFIWYLDGVEAKRTDDGPNTPKPFNRPFYPIINMAVGSNNSFPPNPDGTTPLSGNLLEVDWFEAWSLGGDNVAVGASSVPAVSVRALGNSVKLIKRNTGDPLFPDSPTNPGGGGSGGTTPPPPPPTSFRPWADTSPWNQLIDDSSAVYGAGLTTSMLLNNRVYVSTTGVRMFHGASTDPSVTVTVAVNNGTYGPSGTFVDKIPLNAAGTTSGDHNMEVLGSDGFIYGYFDLAINWSNRTATAGARYRVPSSASGFGIFPNGPKVGPRAAGCAVTGGAITADDIAAMKAGAATFPHAMVFLLNNNGFAPNYVWPGVRIDAGGGQVGPFPYGSCFTIPKSTPPPAGSSLIVATVHRTVQAYGAYPLDRTNGFTWECDKGDHPVADADVAGLNAGPGEPGYIMVMLMRRVTQAKPQVANQP